MSKTSRSIVWFRGKDLRIADHEPLRQAMAAGGDIIPLFVLDPYFFAPKRAQQLPHRMQFLLESLRALAGNLESRGSQLVIVAGKSTECVPELARRWRAQRVFVQRWVEPFARERDGRVQKAMDIPLEVCGGETLAAPGTLRSGSGTPYSVFTHFARAFEREHTPVAKPLPTPKKLPALPTGLDHEPAEIPSCETLGIEHNSSLLPGGERSAHKRLQHFIEASAHDYHRQRDRMDLQGTSRLSADLHFGTLSARQVWWAVQDACGDGRGAETFLNELLWREFAHSTLWDRPELLSSPFREKFNGFPWQRAESDWQAWTTGHTGYPIVDASARQLLGEGFVHNRARMISASFLTKHLLIDYRRGESHYLQYLTDGDWASNNLGWQWSAGCGCDAQPYFRIFNPITQGQKFDPEGAYVRRWVPELAKLPTRYIHAPWTANTSVLREAGVELGKTYPEPVVEHRMARERFLALAAEHLKS